MVMAPAEYLHEIHPAILCVLWGGRRKGRERWGREGEGKAKGEKEMEEKVETGLIWEGEGTKEKDLQNVLQID